MRALAAAWRARASAMAAARASPAAARGAAATPAEPAAPAAAGPPPPPPAERDFQRAADVYLGGIWSRLERELRIARGPAFSYDIDLSEGCLTLALADGSARRVTVCKDARRRGLHVDAAALDAGATQGVEKLHGDATADAYVADFELDAGELIFRERGVADGLPLHSWLEARLGAALAARLDLEPDAPMNARVYGPDPT